LLIGLDEDELAWARSSLNGAAKVVAALRTAAEMLAWTMRDRLGSR
jgi:hypothetical protein